MYGYPLPNGRVEAEASFGEKKRGGGAQLQLSYVDYFIVRMFDFGGCLGLVVWGSEKKLHEERAGPKEKRCPGHGP